MHQKRARLPRAAGSDGERLRDRLITQSLANDSCTFNLADTGEANKAFVYLVGFSATRPIT